MPSSPGTIIAERLLSERDGCQVALAELDDGRRVIVRRITVDAGPSVAERVEALDAARRANLSGFVDLVGMRVLQGGLEIYEELVEGFSLAAAIEPVQQHVTVNVALSLVHDVARSLARLHALNEADGTPARLIHGQLSLDDIIISRRGETRVSGLVGLRGDLLGDVDALMRSMRTLLATRAVNPKGSALLDRLAELEFASCAELARAIEVYLARQDPDLLAQRRRRFTSAVLTVHQDPRLDAPFSDDETTVGEFGDAQVLRGGGEAVAVGLALPPIPGHEDSIPSIDPDDMELLREHTSESTPLEVVPDFIVDSDTAETAAEMMPEGFLEEALKDGAPVGDDAAELGFGRSRTPPPPPPPPPGEDAESDIDDDAREGLLGRAAAPAASGERIDAVQVGDYRVVASIGRGGMGEIYLGREVREGRLGGLVALKVMGMQGNLLESDEQALDMLLDEAKIMAHIDHPNVLKVVDFGKAHGRYYLATEYLEGRPLVRVMIEAYANAGGLDYGVIAAIGAGAAHGLHAAHSAVGADGGPLEIVHRDVSPQNIFVTYDGIAKVIDFGVARATERIAKTAVGLVKGKAAYMSPEQSEGREVDARSDVFSLGVCLWEMAAGCRLFKRDIEYDTLLAVQTAPIEPPSHVRGDPNPVLDHIILNALARDRDRRTQTARDLAAQLEDYARGVGVASKEASIAELLEGLFGEAKEKEQALIRDLERRIATPEEVAQLEALSGVAPHHQNFEQITLVGAPDSLAELDDFGTHHRRGSRVIEAVEQAQAEREGPPLDISVGEPAYEGELDADGRYLSEDPSEPTQDEAGDEFDVMTTARLPEELVSHVRSELGARPGGDGARSNLRIEGDLEDPTNRPRGFDEDPTELSDEGPEGDLEEPLLPGASGPDPTARGSSLPPFVPPPAEPPPGPSAGPTPPTAPAPPVDDEPGFEPVMPAQALEAAPPEALAAPAAPPPSKRSGQLVAGLLAATFLVLGIAAVLLWQMLPELEDRGPTVALRTARDVASPAAGGAEGAPSAGRPEVAAASTVAVAEAPSPAAPALVPPHGGAELEPVPEPEPEQERAPAPEPAPEPEAEPEAEPERERAPEPEPVPAPAPAPERAPEPEAEPEPEPPPPPPPKPERVRPLRAMLDTLEAQGLEVTKAGDTYMVDAGKGGSLVVDARAQVTSVRSGGVEGYLVKARAPALTSIGWIGKGPGGAWGARGLSVNDCKARVRTQGAKLVLRYGGEGVRLPAGGGLLFDVALSVPPGAERLEVSPLGIALGKEAGGAAVHCRSGWWGKQVVLRRLPPGSYDLRWTGADFEQSTKLVVSESGVDNGELKRVRRPG